MGNRSGHRRHRLLHDRTGDPVEGVHMTDFELWKATGWAVTWSVTVVIPIWLGWKIWVWKGETLNLMFHLWYQDMFRRTRRKDD